MQARTYVLESSELEGSDFTVTYTCVHLDVSGECALVMGSVTDHAMLETFSRLEVRTGMYSEREGAIWLVLTSRYVYEEHVDDHGLRDASRSPAEAIDEAVRLERDRECVLLGAQALDVAALPSCVATALA